MKLKQIKTASIALLFFSSQVFAQTGGYVSNIQPPPQPNIEQLCPAGSGQYQCAQRQNAEYQRQLAAYEQAKQQEAQWLAQQSALRSAQEADQATKGGSGSYKTLQMITQIAAMAAFAKAAMVPPPKKPVWIAVGVVMTGLSMLSGQEKSKMDARQQQACVVASQLSSTANNCGAPPPTFNPSNYPLNTNDDFGNYVDNNGNCTAPPQVCQQIQDSLPPGTTLRDAQQGLSLFASGRGPVRVNPDGSVTTQDGKTFQPGAFGSYEDMIAAGMTPEMAKAALASMNRAKSALDNIDVKSAIAGGQGNGSLYGGEGDFGSAGSKVAGGAAGGNGETSSESSDDTLKRDLASASEGLVKDFNGEMIGVKNDDIFKMMQRRYLLKDKQDTFINTATP